MLLAISLLAATSAAQSHKRGGKKRSNARGNKRCSVFGCSACVRNNRTACETCKIGYALTDDAKCMQCPLGCRTCTTESCSTCNRGFTLVDGRECKACAPFCIQCDEAGPGGCNECARRRMLHVHFDLEGEKHECQLCGEGCRRCSADAGCEECDWLHHALPNGTGCAFSYVQVFSAVAIVFLAVVGCAYCISEEETRFNPPRASSRDDSAEVVHSSGSTARRRSASTARPEQSPPRARKETGGAYPLMPGYSGIEIFDSR